jgi:hypothetical protein
MLRGRIPDWFSLHLLVFETYVKNWRAYLQDVGEEIEKAVRFHGATDMVLSMLM